MRPGIRELVLSLLVVMAITVAGCDRCVTCSSDQPTKPECTFAVAPTAQHFPHEGGAGNVAVNTQSGCSWGGTSNAPWIAVTAITANSVSYAVQTNTEAARTGTLAIAGQTVTVTQDAAPSPPPVPPKPPTPPPPPPPSCTYAVQETPQQFTYQGGSGGFSVSASRADCPWTATSRVPWIAITGGSPGIGNGSVSYLVAGNGGAARTGTISVAGKTVTVVQGAP